MSEQFTEHNEQMNEIQEPQIIENTTLAETVSPAEDSTETTVTAKPKSKKKIIVICSVMLVAIIAGVVAFAFLYKSEFQRVKDECLKIAGMISGKDDYFTIDTYPDIYEAEGAFKTDFLIQESREGALEAIKYANEEFNFNSSLYSKMLETNALMGRQSEENDKYKVSWTYHPEKGLEVTYEKK